MVTISKLLPSQRTTLIFHADQPLGAGNFEFLASTSNTSVVPAIGLESTNLPTSSWVNLGLQGALYLIIFYIFNLYIKKNRLENEQMSEKLDGAKEELKKVEEKRETMVASVDAQIKNIRNSVAKEGILTRRLYDQIDKENRMWRAILIKAIEVLIGRDRAASLEVLRAVVRGAGIKRKEGLLDLNVESLLQFVDENVDLTNEALAREIGRKDRS